MAQIGGRPEDLDPTKQTNKPEQQPEGLSSVQKASGLGDLPPSVKQGDQNAEQIRTPIEARDLSVQAHGDIPSDARAAQTALNTDHINRVSATGIADARGNTNLTDSNGNNRQGILETRPGGNQYFNEAQPDGSWQRSQVVKDPQGNQYLVPVDKNDKPIQGTQVTELKNNGKDNNPNTNQPREQHEQQQQQQQQKPLQGKVEMEAKPEPDKGQSGEKPDKGQSGEKPDGKPVDPNQKAADKALEGKPGDPHQSQTEKAAAEKLAAHDKPGEGKITGPQGMHIDGKLLAQLHTLKMDQNQESRLHLADMIGKFQDGKYQPHGKEVALFEMFKEVKPDQLNGLKNWLTDSGKFPFEFKGLDQNTQRTLSSIFENGLGRGGHELTPAGRLLEMLGDKTQTHGIDKIPTGDQSRTLMTALLNGMRETQREAQVAAASSLSALLGRNLGMDRTTDFRLNSRDLDPVSQALMIRMQNRDLLNSNMADRNLALNRTDAGNELIRPATRPDGGFRLSDAVASMLIGKVNDIGRTIGQPLAVRPGDPAINPAGPSESGRPSESGKPSESDKADAKDDEKKKKLDAEGNVLSPLAEQDLQEKMDQQRKLEEEKERKLKEEEDERLRKFEEEKKKEEEKRKQQEDEEFVYTVNSDQETLAQIAAKYSGRTAEQIYARNINDIMLKDYKGKKYAMLYVGQKLIIPSIRWIEDYKMSMQSYGHIGFNGIPYESAEAELIAKFGEQWSGTPGAAILGNQRRIFSDKDDLPVNRRSFSGKGAVSDEKRKQNVRQGLGMNEEAPQDETPRYTVKLGQQLRSIAQKFYGDPHVWKLLASKNNLSTETDIKGEPVAQLKKGQQLILPSDEEVEEFKNGGKKIAAEPQHSKTPEEDFIDQVDPVELQDLTISADESSMDFSPEEPSNPDTQQDQSADSVPHSVQHPIPKAEYTNVSVAFDEGGNDPLWDANPEPQILDQFVQIIESEIFITDRRGLRISLQLLHGGEWITIYDYEIFADEALVHQYQRSGGRTTTRRSLPAKQARQLAGNHLHHAWQSICREFWRS